MALIRVAQYSSTPGPVTDYQAQNAHLQAFTNQLMAQQFILDDGTAQPVIKQGCYVSHGGSLYIADADTAITGSPSDGSMYIRVSGTTSLTVEFVTDISGYAWNPVYTALTSGSYTLLPYLIVKASAVWTRYNFNPNNHSFGIVKTTGLDTGSGAMIFDQEVKTTSSPTFASVNTGFGANEVYKNSVVEVDLGEISANTNYSITSMDIMERRICVIRWKSIASGTIQVMPYTPAIGRYILSIGVEISSSPIINTQNVRFFSIAGGVMIVTAATSIGYYGFCVIDILRVE